MIFLLVAGGAALALDPPAGSQVTPPPALQARAPERPDGAEFWTTSDERMTFTAAEIGFPRRAGAVALVRSIAFGQRNVGLDNGLIYGSDDQEILATAYIYLPGLAHEGLAAVVSEHFMRVLSGDGFRALGSRTAAAGGRDGVAIRADFSGFRNAGEASASAFMRVGRWIVKLRVSGPESRRADVDRTIAALLDGLRFGDQTVPGAASPFQIDGNCPGIAGPAASLSPPDGAEAMEDALLAVGEGMSSETPRPFEPAIGRRWCVSSTRQVGGIPLPILRAAPAQSSEDTRRSLAIAILNDSGGVVEVVERRLENRSRFMLLHHGNAQTRVLGSYDGLPNDAQLGAVITGTDRAGGQARATITYSANGDSNIGLHIVPD